VKPLIENLKTLGRGRLIALGATGAGLMLALLLGLNTVLAPTYAPLYSQLSPTGASDMLGALEKAGIPAELSTDGGTVSVPQAQLARARMVLADGGLPGEGVPGWELFDTGSGLGMNTFMQRVNRLRALEGELARSIQTIDGIDAARVHLVLPEREAFSRQRPEPTASVIVRGRPSQEVSRRQAMAIRALVASAVPELSPSRVTVLSASGETILGEEGGGAMENSLQSARASVEERMARSVTDILSARVGAGNARVQVSVDLTTEREVIVSRSFDPSQQVARTVETRDEEVEGREAAAGEVSVGNNVPDALQQNGPGTPTSTNKRARTDEVTQYEIGSTQSETTREPGDIERVSIAVLVNGIYNVQPDGSVEYQERSPEELARLEALVRSAVGFDEARGDKVQIDSLRFMDYSMELGDPVTRTMGTILADNLMTILRSLFALAVIATIMAFGAKPLRQLAAGGGGGELALAGAGAPAGMLAGGGDGSAAGAAGVPAGGGAGAGAGGPQQAPALDARAPAPQIAGPTGGAGGGAAGGVPQVATGTVLDPLDPGADDTIAISAVSGEVRRQLLNDVGELAEAQPDEALRVLSAWLAEDA